MTTPLISIVLPFRNTEQTLDQCLKSIRDQSFRNYQLLAVNDHSSDGSVESVAAWAADDSRIRLLHSPERGIVSALNHGLFHATAPVVARMDADDIMHQDRLLRQYEYLSLHPDLTLLGCGARLFPEEHVQNGYREYMRWQNGCNDPDQIADEIYLESPFAHPSVIFMKDAVISLGGYRQGPFPEDYDLWLRLHQAGHRMAKLPDILLEWREYPDRTSRTDERCSREAFDRLRGAYLAKEPRLVEREKNFVIWGAGRKTRKRCRHLMDYGFKPRAWIDIDPRKIGNIIDGVPVVSPDWLLLQDQRPFVLVYVANHGARDLIASDLQAMGFQRGSDYLPVG